MFFYLNETKVHNPYYNLAREEALALNMKEFGVLAGLRFWRNPDTIVLGISDVLSRNVSPHIFKKWKDAFVNFPISKKHFFESIYIARRASGGGTVFQTYQENINFSFFVEKDLKPELSSVVHSYEIFLGLVQKTLKNQKIFVELKGHSDLSFTSENTYLKVSGNSQFRKKNAIVHHGTLILSSSLIQKMETLLLHPPKEPEYRKNRKHSEFLKSLPIEFDLVRFQNELKENFLSYLKISLSPPIKAFWKKVAKVTKELQITKYQNPNFLFERE